MQNASRSNGRAGGLTHRIAIAAGALALGTCVVLAAVGLRDRPPATAAQRAVASPASEPFASAVARAIAHGQRVEAGAMAQKRGESDPEAAAALARLAVERGQYEDAERLLRATSGPGPRGDASLQLGLLLAARGRRDEALDLLKPLASAPRGSDAAAAVRSGMAARALGRAHDANSFFLDAAAAAPRDPVVYAERAELFLEKHDRAEAASLFRKALELDELWAPAHLGLARAMADEDRLVAATAARRAAEVDPGLAGVQLFLAESALDSDRRAEARQSIDRALEINPRSPAAHSLIAALAHLEGRAADAEAAAAAALAVNPTYGDVYRVPAEQLAANGRFEDALPLARRAAELEPWSTRTLADLGMHLLRAGEETQAREVLERAFKADAFDVVTFNLLQMLDTLDRFVTVPVGNVRLRADPAEAPVLQVYARPIIEEALARYASRYGLEPRGPILVEIFPKHDHFAVRTLGIPGLLGALGACFGRVVTLDSPRARPPNTFNWQATLWHELAHVFTLQASAYRLPRWLSEGISVYEEGRVNPEWAADAELSFLQVYSQGRVPKLAEFNAAFTRPDLVSAAYFQAFLVVQLLVDRHGEEALRRLVSAFTTGASTDEALKKATGSGLAELQAALDELLPKRYGGPARALQVPEGVDIRRSASPEELVEIGSRHHGSYPVQMAVGQALARAGAREKAMAAFERAARLIPFARGDDSPQARIANLSLQAGDESRALRELEALVRRDHSNVTAARQLAGLAEKTSDRDLLSLAYSRIATVDPFDATAHTALGRIALNSGDSTVALREFHAALAAGPVDRVSAHCDLGEAALLAGRRDEARRAAIAALEIAPTYERAQELLLKASEGK